ncbi:hypothetical protein PCCS19_36090 [Paenibacillus sp. CCS19]|uniref:McrB family protein n=1 Tax=Paenibacillus sp. CCS19 TaxID=3158387 RepID=UPI00256AC4BC|nr:AAA family ATPase [Paenibacillus cellulosilyticus]GMK40553.1 hypothetical protein PCCS19_36090 [Paenibacillus cellulosilyticus]
MQEPTVRFLPDESIENKKVFEVTGPLGIIIIKLRRQGEAVQLCEPGVFDSDGSAIKNWKTGGINGRYTLKEFISDRVGVPFSETRDVWFGKLMNLSDTGMDMKPDIKMLEILDFLRDHGGEYYKDPEKADNDVAKKKMIELKDLAKSIGKNFSKIGQFFISDGYVFDEPSASKWLDGSGNGIRTYFWIELKFPHKEMLPTSISIFAEKKNDNLNYRVSLEIKDSKSDIEGYKRHNKFLDILNPESVNFEYFVTTKAGLEMQSVSGEQILTTIEKVKNREYRKLQIGRTITYDEILRMDSIQFLKRISDVIVELEPYYKRAVEDGNSEQNEKINGTSLDGGNVVKDKNIILYGPPGTGKTYNTVKYALAIIENKSFEQIEEEVKGAGYDHVFLRYKAYKEKGQIAFTTFHQSFGYEEFIEGIKPIIDDENTGEVKYALEPGVFKAFCDNASKFKVITNNGDSELIAGNSMIWKISLEGAGDNPTKKACFRDSCIRIGWDHLPEHIEYETECDSSTVRDMLIDFQDTMSIGDVVLSLFNKSTIDAIGIVTGDYIYDNDLKEYKRKRTVKWLATNIREDIYALNGNTFLTTRTLYKLNRINPSDLMKIIEKYQDTGSIDSELSSNNQSQTNISLEREQNNYVFIIDEINRGNISKIFGELITLIESSKRLGKDEELTAILPYSKKKFGVPDNVYILGTMNTADRSIALLDTALRRRFKFIEMMPQCEVLDNVLVQDINVSKLLETINKRIEVLYDREHMIGHAYFIELKKDPSIDRLASIFNNSIIPLLQEYFYEDYKKIQLVLGDLNKKEELRFIKNIQVDQKLFGNIQDMDFDENEVFLLNQSALYNIEAYKQVYNF